MKIYPKELVLRLAEKYKLAITILSNGRIYGLTQHLHALRLLLDAQEK